MTNAHTTSSGVEFQRTPSSNFDVISDFPYSPHYIDIDGLQLSYIDEGPRDAPVVLMVHGMPTWSYLYRHMISEFLAAGYRCVAPDHIGFGRSDKPTDRQWYSIGRHSSNFQQLVQALDLTNTTLVVQDWGGPIGLSSYVATPERFSRIVIMNTWLHHDEYEYSPGIQRWIEQNSPDGVFAENIPSVFNWGLLMALATERVTADKSLLAYAQGQQPQFSPEALMVKNAYDAPFVSLGDAGVSGPRRFPLSIPFNGVNPESATAQKNHFAVVNATKLPVHFIWGTKDNVFTTEWGKKWHSLIPHSTWHETDGGHFLQDTHGSDIARHVLIHMH